MTRRHAPTPWLAIAVLLAACAVASVQARPAAAAPAGPLDALDDAPAARLADRLPTRPCPPFVRRCFKPVPEVPATRTLGGFLAYLRADLDRFWKARMSGTRFTWTTPRQVQLKQRPKRRTDCAAGLYADAKGGPFYCDRDRPATVFLPEPWLRRNLFPRGDFVKADFAIAYVVAHEWAHHAQGVQGILQDPALRGRQVELMADCLSGVWAYSKFVSGELEPGDVAKALREARLVGDTPGVVGGGGAHGTPAQRAKWFRYGFSTGDPSSCARR